MLPVSVVITPAVVGVAWSATVRRQTWRIRWERPNTLAVTLQGVALLLVAPTETRYLGRWLQAATGVAHLDDYLGHLCYLAAGASIVYAAGCRVADDQQLVRLTMWAAAPGVMAAHVMMAALVCSNAPKRWPRDDFFAVPVDNALRIYWFTYAGAMVWILGFATWLLMILRKDPRSRTSANFFIAGCLCGAVAGVVRIHASLTPDPNDGDISVWILACVAGLLCAVGAGHSWRAKTRLPARNQRDSTPPRGMRL